MYVPKHYAETDRSALHAVIADRPFATWVVHADTQLIVNHLPLVLHADRGEFGTLVGHVARANPVWRSLQPSTPSVMIFHGPQNYVTPSWYPSKQVTGQAVPTWNYLVVHAHGIVSAIHDLEWLRPHVSELTQVHERERPQPWTLTDAPADYIENLLNAIVGIEMPVERLEGKRKLGQNRSEQDITGVLKGLSSSKHRDVEMIQLMSEAVRSKRA